jgi:hypothetical protein
MSRSEAERALLVARRIGQPTGIGMAFFATGVALEIDDPAASLGAFEQAIEIWRTRADRGEIGMALAGVTRLRMASGDVKGALAAARDGVAHYHHFGLAPQVVGLINEAIVALAASDHAEPAAALAGIVASGSIASLPMTFNPERMAAVVEQLRVDLGSQRYDAAFGRGEAMVRDDAVKFVLDELDRLVGELPDS